MDETLDATGLKCPLPVLKAKKALKKMEPGATLLVKATDPGAPRDFEEFCSVTGTEMLDCQIGAREIDIRLRKSP